MSPPVKEEKDNILTQISDTILICSELVQKLQHQLSIELNTIFCSSLEKGEPEP